MKKGEENDNNEQYIKQDDKGLSPRALYII